MKNMEQLIKKSLLLVSCASALALSSCDNFFERNPYTFTSPETFYTNEKECTMALAGIYNTLDLTYGNDYSVLMSQLDDMSYYNRKYANDQPFFQSHSASTGTIYNVWTNFYAGINNANVLLEKVDAANISDEAVRNRIKGEAKFLRAYYHWLLVQGWYEVPLRKHSVDNINTSSLEATPHKEALDWIIEEMEGCLELVDDSEYDLSPSHVKKTVVEGILARVCLWTAGHPANGGKPYYEKAAKYAKAVVDSHKHQLHQGDIYAIWKYMHTDSYDTEYNESMWEVEFIGTRDDGNWTDSRIGNTIGNLQQNSQAGNGVAGYSYAFYAGSLLLWDLFEKNPGDLRRDLSMAPYKLDKNDKQVAWKATQIVDRCCGKFRREWSSTFPKSKNTTEINFPLLRYADVLLMLAEAENEANQGPTTLAYTAINEVRTRAGIGTLAGLSYAAFQQELRDERARELCFEALRRYDLVRWGIYYHTIHDVLNTSATTDSRSTNYYKSATPLTCAATEEKHQFFPIPLKELGVNVLLKQNKYWIGSAE